MAIRSSLFLLCIVVVTGCASDKWPEPPPMDQTAYRNEYAALTKEQQETAADALSLVGAWELAEGDTQFGSDPALPIVLPANAVATHGGVFRRAGNSVTVIPERGVRLTREDG